MIVSREQRDGRAGGVSQRAATIVGVAALLGGFIWLVLLPAAELERRDLLSYDAYNRFLAPPLLLFALALTGLPRVLNVKSHGTKIGSSIAAAGAALLLAGNLVEFYGVLLQDGLNAQAAHEAGTADHWVGSDVGWIIFIIGMLALLVGGLIAAVSLRRSHAQPMWLTVFTGTLGIGVLAGNLFGLAPALLSVPVLALYGAAWICFGIHVLRARRSAPRHPVATTGQP